jgi:hypothetical protein
MSRSEKVPFLLRALIVIVLPFALLLLVGQLLLALADNPCPGS